MQEYKLKLAKESLDKMGKLKNMELKLKQNMTEDRFMPPKVKKALNKQELSNMMERLQKPVGNVLMSWQDRTNRLRDKRIKDR